MAGRRGNKIAPDTLLEISIRGDARRWVREKVDWPDAVDRIRDLMGERTDIAGEAAGSLIGSYLDSPGTTHWETLRAALMICEAGADPDYITAASDQTRRNIKGSTYTDPVSQAASEGR